MDGRIGSWHIFIQVIMPSLLLYSVSIATEKETKVQNIPHQKGENLQYLLSITKTQKDITTPMTTFPTTNPMLNPTASNPDSASTTTNPMNPLFSTPATSTTISPPSSSIASWCIASQSASQIALQVALDYACGFGGSDCSAIQPGGNCYNPNTVYEHASYAFNSYYQKNPIPNSCNFGGSAIPTSTDPSFGTCQFQSTSTTSTILNATNSSGSRVYGAGPITPTSSSNTLSYGTLYFHMLTFLLTLSFDHANSCGLTRIASQLC